MCSILHTAIVAKEIKRESCLHTNHTAWWLNQTDFLVDVDVTLTNILAESETGDRLTNFGVYVTFWFTTCMDFDYEIQDVGALLDKPDRNLVKMDRYGASIMSVECIEAVAEEMWNMKVEGAMEDADKRKAFPTHRALMSAGNTTVGQLVAMSDADLCSLGRVNVKNIISRLDRLGLRLALTKGTR